MKKFALYLAIITILLTGCAKQPEINKDKFTVVTSFYPMYVFTMNIAEGAENVEVHNMTKPQTGCLHDYQLLPEDIKILETSNLFVINGAGMENFMDRVIKSIPTLKIVEAADGIELISDGDEENSHVWMSGKNAIKEVENIAKGLETANPENAEIYKKNAQKYIERLKATDNALTEKLNAVKDENIVVSHEAFAYMARDYEFNIVGFITAEHNQEPSAKDMAKLAETIKKKNVKAIFTEPGQSDVLVKTLASETGAGVFELDPMVNGEDEYKNVYEDTLKTDADILVKALVK